MYADHGECFGEQGFYGHGFYHPTLFEASIVIFNSDPDMVR